MPAEWTTACFLNYFFDFGLTSPFLFSLSIFVSKYACAEYTGIPDFGIPGFLYRV